MQAFQHSHSLIGLDWRQGKTVVCLLESLLQCKGFPISFSGFINAVQAYYNHCPSHTLRITPRNMPFQKTGRLAAHLMPHEYTDAQQSSVSLSQSVWAWKCLFQLFHLDTAPNGRFWLSAGLEYLPSGIPGLASAATTLPTADWDSFSTLPCQSIIS